MENKGKKFDEGKPRWSLLDYKVMTEVVKCLTVGAEKYGDENYKDVPKKKYIDAHGRHMAAYLSGEMNDPDDGLSHIAHAIANLIFVGYHDNNTITEAVERVNIKPINKKESIIPTDSRKEIIVGDDIKQIVSLSSGTCYSCVFMNKITGKIYCEKPVRIPDCSYETIYIKK